MIKKLNLNKITKTSMYILAILLITNFFHWHYSYADDREQGFVFFFDGNTLLSSMNRIAKNNGYALVVTNGVSPQKLKQRIYGKFKANNFNHFMDLLSKQYGFDWFIFSDKIYITTLDDQTMILNVVADNMLDIKNYLDEIGLLYPKYSFSELPEQNKIVITGPKAYVNLVAKQISTLGVSNSNQQFAIYHLKYANASDTQLTFNGQTINIPGVTSILSGLIGGGNKQTNFNALTHVANQLPNGIKSNASDVASNNSIKNLSSLKNFTAMPKIEADTRLNSIIIWDKASNLRLYKNIIKELDVPSPIIQIDVLIVRIDQDKLAENGINWWASSRGAGVGYGTANLTNGPTNSLVSSYGQINPGQLLITNLASFSSSLEFLETNQYAKTVAKPSLATIDNLPAMTNTVENIFSANVGTNNMNQNSSTTNNPNNFAYNGMQLIQSLSITPHVIFSQKQRNKIRLTIAMQDGSIDNFSNPLMPNYSQGQINSQAVIDEGQSIVLAGYTKNENIKIVTQVPFLGSIPVLGWLFKTSNITTHRITTMYMVTPKIIYDNLNRSSNTSYIESSNAVLKPLPVINSSNNVVKTSPKKDTQITFKNSGNNVDDNDLNDEIVNTNTRNKDSNDDNQTSTSVNDLVDGM